MKQKERAKLATLRMHLLNYRLFETKTRRDFTSVGVDKCSNFSDANIDFNQNSKEDQFLI